ncbi:MAG TPA: DNA starvation/stationary phase protection protein [Gammaproteobacteria bacterium]|nr:DNA starvation/stationary phase protection protein [Gammaproteobacteria bacterium]
MNHHESYVLQRSIHHLRVILASTHALYLKTHGFHWNIESPHFASYHKLFEEQYNALFSSLDDIAERIRSLGEYAPYSTEEYQTLSMVLPSPLPLDDSDMIAALRDDHLAFCEYLVTAIQETTDSTDYGTTDFLTQRLQAHEKMLWMLNSTR